MSRYPIEMPQRIVSEIEETTKVRIALDQALQGLCARAPDSPEIPALANSS
ncbi:MAG: hypothetical protein ACREUD_05240 [Gammaproteobacteria bacterium]